MALVRIHDCERNDSRVLWWRWTIVVALVTVLAGVGTVTIPGARPGSAAMAVASCTGRDLVGAVTGQQAGAGNGIATIAFTNVSTSTCRLGGYPQLRGVRGGREYALRVTGHATQYGNLEPVNLAPRMSGALILNTASGCVPGGDRLAARHTYVAIIVVLAGGRGTVLVPGELYVPCQLWASQLGWSRSFRFLTSNRPRGA